MMRLSHRCLSVLLAYVMLISPAGFEQAARASLDYSGIAASDWATSDDSVAYAYDDSGRQIAKTTNATDTSGQPDSLTTYLIGDDVIAQTVDGDTQYLLYDGHGSTRQLAEYDTDVTIADSYSYDGYGVLLQDDAVASADPGCTPQQATNLLYAGEHFDTDSQNYYLRARYYNPLNGRFNRVDPYSGNTSDPQSLHKYLYCHANPVNGIDPSGLEFSLTNMVCVAVITGCIAGIVAGQIVRFAGGTAEQIRKAQTEWFFNGLVAGAIVYAGIWFIHTLWIYLTGGSIYGGLEYANQYGIRSFSSLRESLSGTGLHAHHIIEKRFAETIGIKANDILSVAVNPAEHEVFNRAWSQAIGHSNWNVPVNTLNATKEDIWMAAQKIYENYPALLDACRAMIGING